MNNDHTALVGKVCNDVKGAIGEGLLERDAADVNCGVGRYFRPRALIVPPPSRSSTSPGEAAGKASSVQPACAR